MMSRGDAVRSLPAAGCGVPNLSLTQMAIAALRIKVRYKLIGAAHSEDQK